MDVKKMRRKSEELQWSVDDIDWDAPGHSPAEETEPLKGFMADLTWIEYVALPVFTSLADGVSDPDLKRVYMLFQEDERRHSEAEAKLMARWKMIKPGEMPTPTPSIRVLQNSLQRACERGDIHPSILAAVIPLLELMLDGAFVRFVSDRISDPVFHEVFKKINADEARHLTIDYYLLESYGQQQLDGQSNSLDRARRSLKAITSPHAVTALFFGFWPYIATARTNLQALDMDWELINNMLRRYLAYGDSNPAIRANTSYQIIKGYAWKLERGSFVIEDIMRGLSDGVAGSVFSPIVSAN